MADPRIAAGPWRAGFRTIVVAFEVMFWATAVDAFGDLGSTGDRPPWLKVHAVCIGRPTLDAQVSPVRVAWGRHQ